MEKIFEDDTLTTVRSAQPQVLIIPKAKEQKAFNQLSQSAVYKEDDISATLTCRGGSYGGGVNA